MRFSAAAGHQDEAAKLTTEQKSQIIKALIVAINENFFHKTFLPCIFLLGVFSLLLISFRLERFSQEGTGADRPAAEEGPLNSGYIRLQWKTER